MKSLATTIEEYLPEIISLRHHIHANPEMGYEEVRTSGLVQARLEKQGGFTIESGIAQTGVVATLGADKNGKGIALRADMDCLPILEQTGKEWASQKPGFMHACGHDGHTSCLLGTALVLSEFQNHLKGPVKFIFQPAEEGGAGGEKMVKAGVLQNPQVDMIFGLHGWPNMELGQITTCKGPMMANADEFQIFIHGRGGHAAYPHACVDPIVIAGQVVTALQSIASRSAAPQDMVVVTVGKIAGGTAFNIIPDTVELLGTIRTLSASSQEMVFARIQEIVEGITKSMGGKAEVKISRGYPVLSNHPDAVDYLQKSFAHMEQPVEQVTSNFPQMVGEDFAYFARTIPACFFGLGLRPKGTDHYPQLHQANFDFNDEALPVGMRCFSELVLNFWD